MTLTEARPHVSYGDLYLYRDAQDAWGHPDVLTDVNGNYYMIAPEVADALAEALENAEGVAGLLAIIDRLITNPRLVEPPTPAECIAHLKAGGVIEEQAKGWRKSGRGGLWEEAFYNVADYEEWNLQDVPRGFLRLLPLGADS